MKFDLSEFLRLIVPGIVAVLGNLLFYYFFKGKVDKSIEKHKIAYSGVFKERIDIYRELLKKVYLLNHKIQQYQYQSDENINNEIRIGLNELIQYYLINCPFLSDSIIKNLNSIKTELQEVYEDFFMYHRLIHHEENQIERLNKFFKAESKFNQDGLLVKLEREIILEMRRDLQIDMI